MAADMECSTSLSEAILTVSRPSRWCDRHIESYSLVLMDPAHFEQVEWVCKYELVRLSAGWGLCKHCYPGAELFSDEAGVYEATAWAAANPPPPSRSERPAA